MKNIFCFLVINLLITSSLNAEVAESYKCKLKDGVSRDQIIGLGESYIAVGKKEKLIIISRTTDKNFGVYRRF